MKKHFSLNYYIYFKSTLSLKHYLEVLLNDLGLTVTSKTCFILFILVEWTKHKTHDFMGLM